MTDEPADCRVDRGPAGGGAGTADEAYMARAIALGRRGIGLTDPNPSVGCVIVRDGRIVGEGTTSRAGGPHAEVNALARAGGEARGADVFVTLEPCVHTGRTGPCTAALIAAGVRRVVAANVDPFPQVNGGGLAALNAAGIETSHGCLAASARAADPGYWSRLERGRPWVRLKLAASLDGHTALGNGASQWITGPQARADVHRWRARSSAIVTGIGTVLADDPALTARPDEAMEFLPPAVVVMDSALRTPPAARLFAAGGDVIVFHSAAAPHGSALPGRTRLEPVEGAALDPALVARRLGELEFGTVWVEAGPTLAGAWLESGLVDELIVYLAPDLLGSGAREMAAFGPLASLRDRLSFEIADLRRFGRDLRIVLTPATVRGD